MRHRYAVPRNETRPWGAGRYLKRCAGRVSARPMPTRTAWSVGRRAGRRAGPRDRRPRPGRRRVRRAASDRPCRCCPRWSAAGGAGPPDRVQTRGPHAQVGYHGLVLLVRGHGRGELPADVRDSAAIADVGDRARRDPAAAILRDRLQSGAGHRNGTAGSRAAPQGGTRRRPFTTASGLQHMSVHNIHSFQTRACDDYWRWAWWAEAQAGPDGAPN